MLEKKRESLGARAAFRLRGLFEPKLDMPGFISAIFDDEKGSSFVANVAENGVVISGFQRADVDRSYIIPAPERFQKSYSAGEPAIFSFSFPNGRIEVGTRPELGAVLRKKFNALSRFPLAQLEIASFLNQRRLLAFAIRRSLPVEMVAHGGDVRESLYSLASDFKMGRSELRAYLALDFARALLVYYRIFHRLIHVRDTAVRQRLSYRFRSATDNIVPFLLNESLFRELPESAGWEDLDPVFPSLGHSKDRADAQLQSVLRRLGVNANVAKTYVSRVVFSRSRQVPLPKVSDVLGVKESLETLSFRNAYKATALSRLQKKQRKAELDREFMDLVFGLSLVLSQELNIVGIDAHQYSAVQHSIVKAVDYFAKQRH